VLSAVVEGLANKEIAARVHISEALVKVTPPAALREEWHPHPKSARSHRTGAEFPAVTVRFCTEIE